MAMLSIEGVHTFYGHIEALKGVSLEVAEGEIVDGEGEPGTIGGETTSALIRQAR